MELSDLQTPALLIRLDRVDANLARMTELLGGDLGRWQPHVKTAKIPQVLDRLLAAGLRHFKCATSREAAVLLERADEPVDLLVAMAHHGANLARLAALAQEHSRHRLSVLSEDPDHARAVRASAPELGIYLDLDPGFHRSGVSTDDRARIAATRAAAGEALRGLHFYEGHLRQEDPGERRRRAEPLYRTLLELADESAVATGEEPELITSGTPSFEAALDFAGLRERRHRVSPGTVVYWDTTSRDFGIQGFAYAASVLTRVVSHPGGGRITCDAGSKAVDAACGDPCASVLGWPGLRALTPSEEHLPLALEDGDAPAPGALLELVPRHVCPTVNLADQAVLLEGETVVGIVPVAARGHETLPA